MFKNRFFLFLFNLPAYFYPVCLVLLFILIEFIINPIGNFPLNDDWYYERALNTWNQSGHLLNAQWGYTSMVSHLLFGKWATAIFGYSYTTLRFSTLLWSVCLVLVFYFLFIQELQTKPHQAFILTLLVLFNPISLSLSNSYMTDIPFLSSGLLSVFCYIRYRKTQAVYLLILSALFVTWSIFIRQLGVSFLLGIALSDIVINKKIRKQIVWFFCLPLLSLFAFEWWLKNHPEIPSGYAYLFFKNNDWQGSTPASEVLINFSKRWIHYFSLSGFLLFPLLIPSLFLCVKQGEIFNQKARLIIVMFFWALILWSLRKFPIGNYLYDMGIGPEMYYDTYILHRNSEHAFSSWLFQIIVVLAATGSLSLLFMVFDFVTDFKKNILNNILVSVVSISFLFYYSFLSLSDPIFDRYIMVFSILILFLLHGPLISSFNAFKKTAVVFIFLLGIFSVATCKDYLENNRTKWLAIEQIKKQFRVTDKEINAGYEHEGWLFGPDPAYFDKWKNNPPSRFVLTCGPLDKYHVVLSFSYQRFIPFKRDTIFVVEKNEQ